MRNIPFGKPIVGDEERKAVSRILEGTQLVHGPSGRQFEQDFVSFVGGGRALSVSSCTAGLHLGYIGLGIGPGDEVILPAQTHVATAHAIEYTGAKPIFVDVAKSSGNIDIDLAEAAISPRTKAICVVHYLGLPVDMDRVNALADKFGLFVVEDAALALGARFKGVHVGLLGDVGSFSFYPVKHITTAEGGMLTTRNEDIAERVNRLRAFGYDKMVGERIVPGLYDVDMLGHNYRMNELEAALGIQQLRRLPDFLERRHANNFKLREALDGVEEISFLADGDDSFEHAHYCAVILLNDSLAKKRYEFIEGMRDAGIGVSIYYPGPVPHLKYYSEKYDLKAISYPNASRISVSSVALSVGPHLEDDDIQYVASTVKSLVRGVR